MIKAIADLVDFDLKYFNQMQVIEDFQHKFLHSWVEINGKPNRVENIGQDDRGRWVLYASDLKQNDIKFGEDDIDIIKKITPETGLYASEYGLAYLSRIPARQWIKSLYPGQNYNIMVLERAKGKVGGPNVRNTILNPKASFFKESTIFNDNLFLYHKKIGTAKDGTIYLKSNKYLKEIEELWPQYLITLDAKPQRELRGANLIVDF